ncbi:MAG: GNAT family N-acetyltransferase [Candidatus Omnitrophota bacterium]
MTIEDPIDRDVKIRRFTMDDYDAVIELWLMCGLPAKPMGRDSKERIEAELNKKIAHFLIAELNERIIGTVLATHDGRKGWINRLSVHPEYQRQGLAHRLLNEAETILHHLGIEIIACLIENDNPNSMNFFQKFGYIKHNDITYFSKRKNPDT